MSETTPHQSFKTLSSEIAQSFLQNVMVVDDEAYYTEDFNSISPDSKLITTRINKPGGIRFGKRSESATPSQTKDVDSEEEKREILIHRLNAKILTDAFADKGIACTVIRPKDNKEPELKTRVLKLAEKSDIIIFDWILPGDNTPGGEISEFISEITKNSVEENNKLRLITVYTGNSDLDIVLNAISSKLEGDNLTPKKDDEKLTITVGAVHISVFAKKYAAIPEGGRFYDRKISEEIIPSRLVNDFAEITSGLVSNVALHSFSVIRNNTHSILAKFRPELDAPFLTHRLMLPHPSDAGELLANLIGAEITALLEGERVGEWADKIIVEDHELPFLLRWLQSFQEKCPKWHLKWNQPDSEPLVVKLHTLLSDGRTALKGIAEELDVWNDDDLHTKDITARFSLDSNAEELDLEFVCLTSLNSFRKGNPWLRFGTLLKFMPETGGPTYLLCTQPLCNCVRMKGKRFFPFLKLSKSSKSENFDLVFPKREIVKKNESKYLKASINYRVHDSILREFEAGETETVVSAQDSEKFIFTDLEGGKYQWLGELKFAHAQRVANNYANELSRVGLDESEWQRRWSTKKFVKRKSDKTDTHILTEKTAVEETKPSE